MKTNLSPWFVAPVLLALLITISAQLSTGFAQGTAFTYQGRLNDGANPANGSYDFRFVLFPTNNAGLAASTVLTNTAVPVTNGLFTTTLDFGAGIFSGASYWLDISVRTNGSAAFMNLSPRQPLTPTPYASFANTASNVTGVIPPASLPAVLNTLSQPGGNNFFAGNRAGNPDVTGGDNAAFGNIALSSDTTGAENTAAGVEALLSNTTGNNNTASGYGALFSNTEGDDNTADGYEALFVNTTGHENTANGANALLNNTTGNDNTASGYQALVFNSTGSDNTASGSGALYANTTGYDNTAIGDAALACNTEGYENTAAGEEALYYNTTGNYNTAAGDLALLFNTTGNDNTAVGYEALSQNTTGKNNTAIGYSAGDNLTSGDNNIYLGNAGNFSESGIIRIGTSGKQTATYLAGAAYATSFNLSSDRKAKADFAPVNAQTVLAKVAALPITEWNYKTDTQGQKHLGPMAQDFHAAFDLNGADDTHISVVDEGGVALAAIQGLNEKVQEQSAQMKNKDAEIQALKQRLDRLEKMISESAEKH
jgi:hypothetical protein